MLKQKLRISLSKMIVFLITVLLFTSQPFSLLAQSKNKLKRTALKANNLFTFSEYNKAIPMYLKLLENNPNDFHYNYRIGICYLFSNIETLKSIAFFENARKNLSPKTDSIPDFFYYSGHAYHLANQFDKAVENFNLTLSLIDDKDSIDITFIQEEIKECGRGKELLQSPTKAKVFNLGLNVNSVYPDYAPVIMPDQSMLIFTSKRNGTTGGKSTPDGDYYEDIYISKNISNDWSCSQKLDTSCIKPSFWAALFSPAKSIGNSINTNEHDASISLSPDGKKLFVYRFNAVWESAFLNGIWTKPTKLNEYINAKKSHESSVSLTVDEKTLYFVSERDGGFGGKDIYKSVKQADGSWGEAENLGSMINTEYDEEAPFIDFEDQTLYFSSEGHNSIGGFDIFKTKFNNTEWRIPENLGYPVNSGADDIFFIFSNKANKGYISSIREDGIGNYDIYAVRYSKPANVILFATYNNNLLPLNLKGTVGSPTGNDTIPFLLNKKNNLVYNTEGTFKLSVPEYNTNNFQTFEFKTPVSFGDFPFYQELNYDVVKNHQGQLIGYKTTLINTFFDIEKEVQSLSKKDSITSKEEQYSAFTKTLKPGFLNFQIFSQINYIDTSSYSLAAAEKAYQKAKTAALFAELEKVKREKAANLAIQKAAMASAKAKSSGSEIAKQNAVIAENEALAAKAVFAEANEIAMNAKSIEGEAVKNLNEAKASGAIALSNTTESQTINTPADSKPSFLFTSILFDFSQSNFSNDSKKELEKVFSFLNQNKTIAIEIIGHTDSKGSEKFNLELSKRRAAGIKQYLVKKGINTARIKSIGMGEEKPLAKNENEDHSDNPEGRKLNRRVEFKITDNK